MTSPLPPRLRDTRTLADRVRQDRTNLRQLGTGFVGGRFPPARPLGPEALTGDDDEDDEPFFAWEWNDRLTVTALGTQTFRLSHVPLEESLVVRWHPDGKAPLTQVNERWSLDDAQTVTIPDTGGDFRTGDVFSAQYQYEVMEESDISLVLVGTGTVYATNPTLALPSGCQVGDFIVITTVTGTVSDGRVGQIASHDGTGMAHFYSYAGTLSNLGDFTASGGMTLATWAVFRAPVVAASPAPSVGPGGSPATVPQVTTPHAILVGAGRNGLVDADLTLPAEWTVVVGNGLLFHARQIIAYWDAAADEPSPSGAVVGSFDDYTINVLGVTNIDAGEA